MITHFKSDKYIPKFSGHETFPVRFGWLKKCYDAVHAEASNPFKDENAISKFGVGKNMVVSMQYWAEATDTIKLQKFTDEDGKKTAKLVPGLLGKSILSGDGFDPYLENPSSIWLLHWHLISEHNSQPGIGHSTISIEQSLIESSFLMQLAKLSLNVVGNVAPHSRPSREMLSASFVHTVRSKYLKLKALKIH